MTFGFPGMHVKPLLPSRRIALLPWASVSTIRADSEMLSGPADMARAIFSCIVSPASAGILLRAGLDAPRTINATPIVKKTASVMMGLAKNLHLELWHLIRASP